MSSKKTQIHNQNGFKEGDIVSIWYRDSKRHKWKMEKSFVMIYFIDNDDGLDSFSYQTSTSGCYGEGLASCSTRGFGSWERELRAPVFYRSPKLGRHSSI